MHNGVHAADFADSALRRAETRRRYQIGDQFAVGYLQSWHTTSGLHGEILQTLLPFAREVLSALPSAVLVMIGGGAASEQVREQVQAAVGVAHIDRLRFAGVISHREMPAVLAGLDVGVVLHHSRYYFTSPLKLYEYMAAGAVCIASDLPNHREMIDDGATGILYPPGDVHALVAAIDGLERDPVALRRLADAGRQHVLAEHTWESNARRVVKIIDGLGASAGAPRPAGDAAAGLCSP
jgi:glycosyltransferase involved in cell wall biosynthesis